MEALADQIQNFYDHFPLSMGTVVALTACFLLASTLIFREFLSWYLRLGRLKAELVGVRQDLALLQIKLDQVLALGLQPSEAEVRTTELSQNSVAEIASDPQPVSKPATFPLTH